MSAKPMHLLCVRCWNAGKATLLSSFQGTCEACGMEHSWQNRIAEMVDHLGVSYTIAWSLIALFGLGVIGICAYGISSTIHVEPHIVSPRDAGCAPNEE